jgi:hypothetical protein
LRIREQETNLIIYELDDDDDNDDESCKNSRSQKGDTKQVSY